MAISSTSYDVLWPVVGSAVTISAVYTVGTRIRCKLTERPVDSQIPLFDSTLENYLDGNQLVPDVSGNYSVTVVEETVTIPVPHFSNDLGMGCPESITVVDDDAITIPVGQKLTREIGFTPDTVKLACTGHTDRTTATSGVITRIADRTLCPTLSVEGSTKAACVAAVDSDVVTTMQAIGGYGDSTHYYGAGYGETLSILPWANVIIDPIEALGWSIRRFNMHVLATQVAVHTVDDTANEITTASCTVGSASSQVALLNAIRGKVYAHANTGGAGFHYAADSVNAALLNALTDLSVGATLDERIVRANVLASLTNEHMSRYNVSVDSTLNVHLAPADNRFDYTPASTEASLVTLANLIKTEFNEHIDRDGALYSYHAYNTSTRFVDDRPRDRSTSYVQGVNTLLDLINAHVSNVIFSTGVSTAFHTDADRDNRTDMLPRASNFNDAVKLHAIGDYLMTRHAMTGTTSYGTQVHPVPWPGFTQVVQVGVDALEAAFFAALQVGSSWTAPSREIEAVSRLVMFGGFSPAT